MEQMAIDVHEVTLYIKLEHIAIFPIVMTCASDMMRKAVYAIMRASPTNTTIGVCDKEAFVEFVCIVVIKMVNHTIAKVCSEDFSLLWVADNKANALTRAILSRIKFF